MRIEAPQKLTYVVVENFCLILERLSVINFSFLFNSIPSLHLIVSQNTFHSFSFRDQSDNFFHFL